MMHAFEIVAEPVRRRIIEVLAVGEHPVGVLNDVIAQEFSISRSAVSHHLRILRDEGVVSVAPDRGLPQSRLYVVNGEYLARLDDAVGELFALWEQRYGTGVGRAPQFPARLAPPVRKPRAHRAGHRGQRGRRHGWFDEPSASEDRD
ncbi:DNA-binding transcriptional ArsR family regulator [Agromyces hippuratus]|uniref:DNA-binding transcriptional ArsR family regulator n=1 Tax=Agromyces hippuratus TaxID=286438 RepID=A0A852WUE2_9MICO|nr:metalloregulator ArsR/SmtB family transcription factor [Agromyces hippuratus]NYG21922.1 DNA-binding transcriptional ArsR family regulator [Agromyces hippuratus]